MKRESPRAHKEYSKDTIPKLKESEEKFKTILENVNEGIVYLDKYGKILYVNKKLKDIFGYKPKEVIGKNFVQLGFLRLKDVPKILKLFKNVIKKGKSIENFELEIKRKDDKTAFIDTSNHLIKKGGRIEGMIVVVRDITERKKLMYDLDKRVREFKCLYSITNSIRSERSLEKLLKNTTKYIQESWQHPDVTVSRLTFDGKEYKSPGFKETKFRQIELILVEGEIRGQVEVFYTKKMPEEDWGPFLKEERKLLQEIASYLGAYVERLEAKEEIKKFKTLSDKANYGVAITDLKGNVTYINEYFANVHDYTPNELIGKNLSIFHSKEQLKDVMKITKSMIKTGSFSNQEVWHRRKDGTEFPMLMNGMVVEDEDGRPLFMATTATDITERKNVEKKLKLFSQSVDSSIDGIAMGDPDGKITYVNEVFTRMFGYSREELIGKEISFIYSKDQMPKLEEALKATIEEGGWTGELVGKRKNGEAFPMVVSSSRVVDDKGKVIAHMANHRDITERKKMEEMLRESEEKHKTLYNSSRDAIMMLAPPTWKFTAGNPTTVKLFGCKDQKKFISKGPWEVSPKYQPDGQLSSEKAKKMIMKAMKDGSNFFEWTHKKLNGKNFPTTVLLTRFELNGKKILQATVRDITERKKAEKKLARLSDAVNMSIDSIVITDLKGKIVNVNESTMRTYGTKKKEDLIGKSSFKLVVADKRMEAIMGMKEVLKKGYTQNREYHIITKDGSKIPVEMNVSIMKDANGKPTGFVAISRDVTERKKMKKEINEKIEELENWKRITIDRELKMIQLKKKLKKLKDEPKRE